MARKREEMEKIIKEKFKNINSLRLGVGECEVSMTNSYDKNSNESSIIISHDIDLVPMDGDITRYEKDTAEPFDLNSIEWIV